MHAKFAIVPLVATLLVAGCATEQQTHTAVGTGVGAAVGAGLGNLIGGNTTGTLVGAAVGGALGGATGYNWNAIRGKLSKDTAGTGTQITEQPDGSLKVNIPSQVTFDTDSASIKPSFRSVLDQVAQTLGQHQDVTANVVGHTDSTGNAQYNMQLSQRRAQSVASYLGDRGVARNRLTAEGRGQTQPVADNATEAGRAQNRRVEIFLKPIQG
ncbi:OmpA family protein [Cupriavidus plantarum]|uniref:Outer membrane protein OmpA-like peptidoglycan-associated protein n=2 Tax=Cupriavidus plantarum TaxID=942865 RepID=A0A316EYQ1_9BURK|nr:OmpA family protein [Cupriavidus plantarum]NYH99240.1 outer membrane protein OmpA-like peptidoglycan-associated protein [Cupriavidus plantarum]PWK36479.1 outer membrane protein OmpA-like peptidoglycan-associated protein [Cupriavidus plantarum]REF02783.1 outer membrane protein OmpA-like peptidoglycan-associated protein [Cupriavidus plantarum]RLK44353.1 outer membrane protein OmpA-like peptidoglycan-associated protein [Cupriavidus plantarum]CAG2142680.1 putative lipoprotein YiaD [Cupriavidus 